MKNIVLIRHAKSSWKNSDWSDKERPLKKRGTNDAENMALHFVEIGLKPDIVISSPANRALSTAKIFVKALQTEDFTITTHDLLYFEGTNAIIETIKMQKDEIGDTIFVFGHNPDTAGVISTLSGNFIGHFPTCGVAQIQYDIYSWREITPNNGKLVLQLYPKMMPWHTDQEPNS